MTAASPRREVAKAFEQPRHIRLDGSEQVGEELAADPLLGVGLGPRGQQHERRHHRGPLDRALFSLVEGLVAPHDERGEMFLARGGCRHGPAGSDLAVLHGGASPHRYGLFDGILIKDNHIAAAGGLTTAITRARAAAHHLVRIEVEVEHLSQLDRDPGHPVTLAMPPQQHLGEPVMGSGGSLDRGGAGSQQLVRLVGHGNGGAGLLEQAGVLDRDRRMGGKRGQQRDLARREGTHRPVDGEQRADHLVLDEERHPEDRADLLAGDGCVDEVAVHKAGVGLVVVREIRRARLRHEPKQPRPERQAQGSKLGGQSPIGDLHVGRALGLIVEREVGHVRPQQGARAAHDRGKHGVEIADRGQVVGRVIERGQLGFPGAVRGQLVPQPHGQGMRLRVLGLGQHALERGAICAVEQQTEVGISGHSANLSANHPAPAA